MLQRVHWLPPEVRRVSPQSIPQQSFSKELTGSADLSEGLRSRWDHFMLPQDDNALVPVKRRSLGWCMTCSDRFACPVSTSCTAEYPANRRDSGDTALPVVVLLTLRGPLSLCGGSKTKRGQLTAAGPWKRGRAAQIYHGAGGNGEAKVTTKVGKVVNCWLCFPRKKADRSLFSKIRFIWLISIAHLLATASHHSPREVRIRPCFISQSPLFSRFKKILKIHIPDPKKFFPPLVSVHGGDIQVWDWGRIQVVIREKWGKGGSSCTCLGQTPGPQTYMCACNSCACSTSCWVLCSSFIFWPKTWHSADTSLISEPRNGKPRKPQQTAPLTGELERI